MRATPINAEHTPHRGLERIVAYVGSNDLYASTSPHPSGADLNHRPVLACNPRLYLLSLALACPPLHNIAMSARAPNIQTRKAFNLFAAADAPPFTSRKNRKNREERAQASPNRAASVRAILLQINGEPHPRRRKSGCRRDFYSMLRSFFDHANELDVIAFEANDEKTSAFLAPERCNRRSLPVIDQVPRGRRDR